MTIYTTMKTYYLDVPYNEKEEVKRLGGRWKQSCKMWYITSNHPNVDIIRQKWKEIGIWDDSDEKKSIEEIKQMDIPTIIQLNTHMKPSLERDHLDTWLFDTHYRKITLSGPLTNRIKYINTQSCYREVMKRCFNGTNIIQTKTVRTILPEKTITFVAELHAISTSLTGVFIDYLIRRIISEKTCRQFMDGRAERELHIGEKTYACECYEPPRIVIDYSKYTKKELIIVCKQKDISGYSKLNKDEICEMIERYRRWRLFKNECKLEVGYDSTYQLPICMYKSYFKMRDITNYKTCDIVPEILITCLTHGMCFGGVPQQNTFNTIYDLLQQTDRVYTDLLEPLEKLCDELIQNKTTIELNPVLGCVIHDKPFPADADLILDDTLIDIKCTKSNNELYEILQLLGYAALFQYKNEEKTVHTLKIVNILQGIEISYDIQEYNKENFSHYLNILTNIS